MSLKVPSINEQKEESFGFNESVKIGSSKETPFVRPKLNRKGSETEQRLAVMRQRFAALQAMEDSEQVAENSGSSSSTIYKDSPVPIPTTTASSRWSKLRQVVTNKSPSPIDFEKSSTKVQFNVPPKSSNDSPMIVPQDSIKLSPRSKRKVLKRPSEDNMKKKLEDAKMEAIELEDVSLNELWNDTELPSLPDVSNNIPSLSIISDKDAFKYDMYTNIFQNDIQPLKVTISRIPEEVINHRKQEMEEKAQEERLIMLEKLRKKEEDINYREETAKKTLQKKELETRKRLDIEKGKIAALGLNKEKKLNKDFRIMREYLEEGIKKQQGAIKENFGRLLVHEESLARRFYAASVMAPQPVEFRIHLIRAIKNKLPKGSYVLMLTQYDSIGGRPLSWSKIGAIGIGHLRPGLTKISRHGGRFFDRILRVEDSCYALCPPRPLLKPNYIFVIELFQLANKYNPYDKIVGWSAVPMSYESMSIIEGKMKLPMLRGEHSPAVFQFQQMEKLIAADLHNWLGNIYIEVRHMSAAELGASDEMLKTTDFDMDYFNKAFIPLDVDGNPILSSAQQQALALKQDLEAAGFGASDQQLVDIEGEGENIPLLPVDKGIFRRKGNQVAATGTAGAEGSSEQAPTTTGTAINNTSIATPGMHATTPTINDRNNSNSNNLNNNTTTASGIIPSFTPRSVSFRAGLNDPSGQNNMGLNTPKTPQSRLDLSEESKGHGTSNRSILSMLGIKNSTESANASRNSSNRPLLLKNDDNFLEHRKLLVQRWKDNLDSKAQELDRSSHTNNNNSSFYEDKEQEVLERGYNIQDEVFLHHEQRGKIAGVETIDSKEARQWAQAGLEGKIVRRWQSEGPRFDSEAIGDTARPRTGTGRGSNAVAAAEPASMWEELRDAREMDDYTMAICADAGKRKGIVPGAKSASKLRYINTELFGDFQYYLWGSFEFYMSLVIYLFALWMRIYIHYLAQYLYLQSLGTPVYGFRLMVFQIVQKYMSGSISVAAETGVVAIGPISNLCVFLVFVSLGLLFHKVADYLPEVISKFFAAFGISAVLDPYLIIIIDLIYKNYNCAARSEECHIDYTSNDCKCFNGDFLKLWYRMEIEEGSGLTGLFITILLYMGTTIIGLLMLYYYIVYVHREGRVLDQWRRINGTVEEFFIPHDFEISDEELKEIVHKAIHWRGPKSSRRRLEVTDYTESDPSDPHYLELFKKFIIYEVDEHRNRAIYREFLLEPTGAILEIFDARRTNANTASIFNNYNNNTNININDEDRDTGNRLNNDNDGKESDHDDDDELSEHTENRHNHKQQAGDQRDYSGGSKDSSWLKSSAFPELRNNVFTPSKAPVSSEDINQLDLEKIPLLPIDTNSVHQHSHRSQYSNRSNTSSHPASGRKQQPAGPPPAGLRHSPRDLSAKAKRPQKGEEDDQSGSPPVALTSHRRHLDEDDDVLF